MSAEQSRLRQEQREEQKAEEVQGSGQEGKEFATVEELLRYDSEQNPVPPEVAERLGKSLENEPKQEKPWYKRILGS